LLRTAAAGGVCKHIVAVMLSVLEQQELGQAVKTFRAACDRDRW
jgi:uncharacterized Zn finger protein